MRTERGKRRILVFVVAVALSVGMFFAKRIFLEKNSLLSHDQEPSAAYLNEETEQSSEREVVDPPPPSREVVDPPPPSREVIDPSKKIARVPDPLREPTSPAPIVRSSAGFPNEERIEPDPVTEDRLSLQSVPPRRTAKWPLQLPRCRLPNDKEAHQRFLEGLRLLKGGRVAQAENVFEEVASCKRGTFSSMAGRSFDPSSRSGNEDDPLDDAKDPRRALYWYVAAAAAGREEAVSLEDLERLRREGRGGRAFEQRVDQLMQKIRGN